MTEPPSTKPGYGPVPARPRIFTPGDFAARLPRRAPLLSGEPPFDRDNCVDTGVGIAFKSVDRFDLLTTYISPRGLMVLSDVVLEINHRADETLEPGHDRIRGRVKKACSGLQYELRIGSMTVRELPEEFIHEVLHVQEVVRKHSKPRDEDDFEDARHAGEAASIVWARSQKPMAVVLTNDGGAQRAADELGVLWLNSAQVMKYLIDGGAIEAAEAWTLINKMDEVSKIMGPYPEDSTWGRLTDR